MAVKLFGFTIGREDEQEEKKFQSFAAADIDDGALEITPTAIGGAWGLISI